MTTLSRRVTVHAGQALTRPVAVTDQLRELPRERAVEERREEGPGRGRRILAGDREAEAEAQVADPEAPGQASDAHMWRRRDSTTRSYSLRRPAQDLEEVAGDRVIARAQGTMRSATSAVDEPVALPGPALFHLLEGR